MTSPAPTAPVVALSEVTVTFGHGEPAVDRASLEIAPGEIFGIIGESGAGKTTLLNLLTGSVAPASGSVEVLGRDLATLDRSGLRALRRQLGVVFQGVHLVANRTVAANVAAPLQLGPRRSRVERAAAVAEILRFVGLSDYADRYPAQLSGGQRQRVGIARALVTGPRVLVCDEPTSALDGSTADGVLDLLTDVRDRLGTTVLVVTHDLEVVRAICDRVALVERGRIRDVLPVSRSARRSPLSYLDRAREVLGS